MMTDDEENGGDISPENTLVVIVFALFTAATVTGVAWVLWLKSQLG